MDRREMLERFLTWMREGKSQTWPEKGLPMFERLDDGMIVGLTQTDEESAEGMSCLLARVPLDKLHFDAGVKVERDERDMANPWRVEHDVVTRRVWWNGVYGGEYVREPAGWWRVNCYSGDRPQCWGDYESVAALVRAAKRAWEMVNWPKKADEAEVRS